MVRYKKSSLQVLKERIDVYEVLSSYIDLKKAGSTYKALCPFHDEKTPSFVVQKGTSHYHCFGCGAHGDAIAFLMQHQHFSFIEAIEHLASRYQVHLEKTESTNDIDIAPLRDALEKAKLFYHYILLRTEEGKRALHYLDKRGISVEFIKQFQIGFAPKQRDLFRKVMHEQQVKDFTLELGGLTTQNNAFFQNRIMFPVLDRVGHCVGFSARKIDEETFGGKYINTKATPLFKKSNILFGLYESKKRIAKEKKVLLVEGQLDCLSLIHGGLDCTVATLGTAFSEEHLESLKKLGVETIYLVMDADEAGMQAAIKAGDLVQKKSIQCLVVQLPKNQDPHDFLQKHTINQFLKYLEKAPSYLDFLCTMKAKEKNLQDPTQKTHLVKELTQMIQKWEDPLHVHESLKIVAQKFNVPIDFLSHQNVKRVIKKSAKNQETLVDADIAIETDLLYWLLYKDETKHYLKLAKSNLTGEHFRHSLSKTLFEKFTKGEDVSLLDLLQEEELQSFIEEIAKKRVPIEKGETLVKETIQQLLNRSWLEEREKIKVQIQRGDCSEEEALNLAKVFDKIKNMPPILVTQL
ncbi:MAG: DNA primase [Chlamydiae bacterium]|nr:DNA primase [Chlamydiota bacterium]